MISSPYQMMLMKIRHIYRWDNQTETALYLGAYIFLWAANYLTGAFVSLIRDRKFLHYLTFLDPYPDRNGA